MSLDALSRPVSATAAVPLRSVAPDGGSAVAAKASMPQPPPVPSPRLRLDPALGVVVMEFRSSPGVAARTIPSEQELAAYRAAAISGAPRPGERVSARKAD